MDATRLWLQLVLTLPTANATARMRIWRALKAMGCAVLRDGVYLLPHEAGRAQALETLAGEIVQAGGSAVVIELVSRNHAQDELFQGLFERAPAYAAFERTLVSARKSLKRLSVPELNRLLRRLRREYEGLRAIDFFPGEAAARGEAAWSEFFGLATARLAPDEPHPARRAIPRLKIEDHAGRTWATRRHVWVDRIACAWLIRRFIDPGARFRWLSLPAACPKTALGFDFDGARFTHVGEKVSFEVLLASFGLDADSALVRLGAMVHALDVGGREVPEAAGFEAVMAGARERGLDDDAMLVEIGTVLDSLYAYFSREAPRRRLS